MLDQSQLLKERGELTRRIVPFDRISLAQYARAFLLGKIAPEIAQQARPHPLRLADVDDLTGGGEHSINSGPILGAGTHVGVHNAELILGRRSAQQL